LIPSSIVILLGDADGSYELNSIILKLLLVPRSLRSS
jgi:hypothetical protein